MLIRHRARIEGDSNSGAQPGTVRMEEELGEGKGEGYYNQRRFKELAMIPASKAIQRAHSQHSSRENQRADSASCQNA
jgi:hypothetical protein